MAGRDTFGHKTSLCFSNPSFAGLVVLAESLNPIPSRTRPLNFPAPMVLSPKTWKSRSLPGLPRTDFLSSRCFIRQKAAAFIRGGLFVCLVLWVSSCLCRARSSRTDSADMAATPALLPSSGGSRCSILQIPSNRLSSLTANRLVAFRHAAIVFFRGWPDDKQP